VGKVLLAASGMDYLEVELYRVESARGIRDCRHVASAGASRDREPFRYTPHHVAMAHPDLLRTGESAEEGVGRIVEFERRQSVFALQTLADFSAQQVRHELLAVADAEHRDAERKDGRIHRGTRRVINAARPARDDETP